MKAFLKQHAKLHIVLAAELGLLLLFWLCRGNRGWMNAVADHATTPFRLFLGRLCSRVDFSVMEVLCALLALFVLAYGCFWAVALVRRRGSRAACCYQYGLGAIELGLGVYLGFCLLWGVNYYTDTFQDQSGIYAQPVAAEDLAKVTLYFAAQTAASANDVARDETGLFAVPREEILAKAPQIYDRVEEQFPFLELEDTGVKPVHFSEVMSRMDFTGVYCPFTGESNVNMDSPACMLPATAAHEMAHQRAIASEQECNFLAILASTTCGDPAYVYSGWLKGYIHLSNALNRIAPDFWQAIAHAMPAEVDRDLEDHRAYWKQFDNTPVQKVSTTVYDGFLKSYGDEDGIQSYGTVVDLLVVYYKDLAEEALLHS